MARGGVLDGPLGDQEPGPQHRGRPQDHPQLPQQEAGPGLGQPGGCVPCVWGAADQLCVSGVSQWQSLLSNIVSPLTLLYPQSRACQVNTSQVILLSEL